MAIKWYIEKEKADVAMARKLLDSFGRGECILRAPQLLFYEVANVLAAARKLHATAVATALLHLNDLNIDHRPLEWATLSKAVAIAAECDATVYDSYFLALAIETGARLVTSDGAFLKKARRYPEIVHLRDLRFPA